MADENLDFNVRIRTDVPQLPQAIALLSQLDQRLASIDSGLNRFLTGAQKMQRFGGVVAGVTRSFTELASALSLVERTFGAASRIWGAADAAGSYALSAMGQRTSTMRAMTQLTGSREQAGLEFYRGQQFSQRTDFTSEQIEKSQTRLMAQGFRDKELYATLFAASDLAALMPGNKNETLDRVTMALSQIKSKGRLQGEELTQQLAEAGLNTTLVKQQLMGAYGLKSTQDVDKLMAKGGVSADVALPAIQRAILQQLGTTKAGEYAAGSSGSVQALISNREEAVKNILKGFDADENLPAMERYKKALSEQGRLFDQNSKTGGQLSLIMQDLANTAVEGKSAWAEFQTGFIESFSQSYTDALSKQGRNFASSSIDQLDLLGRSIGRLGSVASAAVNSTDGLFGSMARLLNDQIDAISATQASTGGTYFKGLLQSTLPGMAYDAAVSVRDDAINNMLGRGGAGFDIQGDTRRFLREAERARGEFGEFSGAGTGGGPSPKTAIDALKFTTKTKASAKGGGPSNKAEPYRGVFWAYQGAVGERTWASPNIADVVQNQRETATAITSSVQAQAGQAPITIMIQGYQKDKMDLARTIVSELGRQNRQPR